MQVCESKRERRLWDEHIMRESWNFFVCLITAQTVFETKALPPVQYMFNIIIIWKALGTRKLFSFKSG